MESSSSGSEGWSEPSEPARCPGSILGKHAITSWKLKHNTSYYAYIYMYIIYICTLYIYVYMYIYVYIYVYMYIYICLYIYRHTYIYIYTYNILFSWMLVGIFHADDFNTCDPYLPYFLIWRGSQKVEAGHQIPAAVRVIFLMFNGHLSWFQFWIPESETFLHVRTVKRML